MASTKYQAPWECCKQSCANISHNCTETPSISLVSSLDKNCKTYIQFQNREFQVLFDSGAGISCISEHVIKKLYKNPDYESATISHVQGVCGEIHAVLGTISLSFLIDGFPFEHTFHVFKTLHQPVILGVDFMRKENFQLNFEANCITISKPDSDPISISLISEISSKTDFGKTVTSHVIPPHSEYLLSLKTNKFRDGEVVLCEPPKHLAKDELAGGKCLSTVKDSLVQYRLMNPTALPVFLKANTRISVLSEADCSSVIKVTDHEDSLNSENLNSVYNVNVESSGTLTNEQYIKIARDLGINLDDADLTSEQKEKLLIFIGKNRKCFAKDFSELGLTNLYSHKIETGDSKPVKQAPYRQNPEMRRETERQINELLQNGFIEESDSPWNSPIVLVRKKSGEYRFVCDYRLLNRVTEPMSFPIPHISDVFDTIADAKAEVFSVLDLKSGFWQLPLDPQTASRSAFVTHQGVYSWTRMPFGMMNSSFSFQCLL